MKEIIHKVRLYRGGALGDFILTLPVLKKLKRAFPASYIEVVSRSPAAYIAKKLGIINSVCSLESQEHLFLFDQLCQISETEKEKLNSLDLVISYLNDPEKMIEKQLRNFSNAKILAQTPFPFTKHIAYHLLEPLTELGIETNSLEDVLPLLNLSKTNSLHGRNLLQAKGLTRQTVIIHPGSGSLKKNYPLENFIVVYNIMKVEAPFDLCFLLGEAEEWMKDTIEKAGCNFITRHSLFDVADILAASIGYIGNDSGITHLAAALNLPVIALFGPTSPALWQPLGKNVQIVYRPEQNAFMNISPSEIVRIFLKHLEHKNT